MKEKPQKKFLKNKIWLNLNCSWRLHFIYTMVLDCKDAKIQIWVYGFSKKNVKGKTTKKFWKRFIIKKINFDLIWIAVEDCMYLHFEIENSSYNSKILNCSKKFTNFFFFNIITSIYQTSSIPNFMIFWEFQLFILY